MAESAAREALAQEMRSLHERVAELLGAVAQRNAREASLVEALRVATESANEALRQAAAATRASASATATGRLSHDLAAQAHGTMQQLAIEVRALSTRVDTSIQRSEQRSLEAGALVEGEARARAAADDSVGKRVAVLEWQLADSKAIKSAESAHAAAPPHTDALLVAVRAAVDAEAEARRKAFARYDDDLARLAMRSREEVQDVRAGVESVLAATSGAVAELAARAREQGTALAQLGASSVEASAAYSGLKESLGAAHAASAQRLDAVEAEMRRVAESSSRREQALGTALLRGLQQETAARDGALAALAYDSHRSIADLERRVAALRLQGGDGRAKLRPGSPTEAHPEAPGVREAPPPRREAGGGESQGGQQPSPVAAVEARMAELERYVGEWAARFQADVEGFHGELRADTLAHRAGLEKRVAAAEERAAATAAAAAAANAAAAEASAPSAELLRRVSELLASAPSPDELRRLRTSVSEAQAAVAAVKASSLSVATADGVAARIADAKAEVTARLQASLDALALDFALLRKQQHRLRGSIPVAAGEAAREAKEPDDDETLTLAAEERLLRRHAAALERQESVLAAHEATLDRGAALSMQREGEVAEVAALARRAIESVRRLEEASTTREDALRHIDGVLKAQGAALVSHGDALEQLRAARALPSASPRPRDVVVRTAQEPSSSPAGPPCASPPVLQALVNAAAAPAAPALDSGDVLLLHALDKRVVAHDTLLRSHAREVRNAGQGWPSALAVPRCVRYDRSTNFTLGGITCCSSRLTWLSSGCSKPLRQPPCVNPRALLEPFQ